MVPISDVGATGNELELLFVLIAVACLAGAAYMAFLRNILGAVVLIFIAIVAVILGT